jgi:S1-C subfamily serine protease
MNENKEKISIDSSSSAQYDNAPERKANNDDQISVSYNLIRLLIIIAISFVIVFTISFGLMPFLHLPSGGGSFAQSTKDWNSRTFEIDAAGVKGTAFIAETRDNDAYFITCYHVVESNPTDVKVKIGGTYRDAEFLGKDEYCDIAVVKVPYEGRTYTLDPAQVSIGESVRVLGNSDGKGIKVAEGIISDDCYADLSTDPKGIFYEVTAHIAQGMSGGAVFTEDGSIVGVAARRTHSAPVNYVTPYCIVKSAYDRIVDYPTERAIAYTVNYDEAAESETVSFVDATVKYDGFALSLDDKKIVSVKDSEVSSLADFIAKCTDYSLITVRRVDGVMRKTVKLVFEDETDCFLIVE